MSSKKSINDNSYEAEDKSDTESEPGNDTESEQESDTGNDTDNDSSSDSEKDDDISKLDVNEISQPFILRKSYPFCFWYISNSEDNLLIKIKKITLNVIKQIFNTDTTEIYIIQGCKEKDRLRVVCPNIYVNVSISKDIRSLILRDLGYKGISNIIPVLMYEVPLQPTVLMPRIWDMGYNKWESYQKYSCIFHPHLKTEQLEKLMLKWNKTVKEITEFSNEYIEYLKVKATNENILENDECTVQLNDGLITDDIKKDFGNNLEKCVQWFKKYHPDSSLRTVKKIGDNDIFFLDFSKSKQKCRLCDLVHLSNRQYVTYSTKSKKAFYHCYDCEAKDKKHTISFQKQNEVMYVN